MQQETICHTLNKGHRATAEQVRPWQQATRRVGPSAGLALMGGRICSWYTPAVSAPVRTGEDGGDGETEGGEPDADGPSKARRRAPAAGADPSATLEDADALRAKDGDPTFAVDPLFRKTSAQFDEGGAKGAPTLSPKQHYMAGAVIDPTLHNVQDIQSTWAQRARQTGAVLAAELHLSVTCKACMRWLLS